MARPARAYVLASALALVGMAWRMEWISAPQIFIAVFILCVLLGLGLLLGLLAAITWVFIWLVQLIFGRQDAPFDPPQDEARPPC